MHLMFITCAGDQVVYSVWGIINALRPYFTALDSPISSLHAPRYSFALERPDYAIANYFMVQRLAEPLRAALDLPSHDLEVRNRRLLLKKCVHCRLCVAESRSCRQHCHAHENLSRTCTLSTFEPGAQMTFENATDIHFEPQAGAEAQVPAQAVDHALALRPAADTLQLPHKARRWTYKGLMTWYQLREMAMHCMDPPQVSSPKPGVFHQQPCCLAGAAQQGCRSLHGSHAWPCLAQAEARRLANLLAAFPTSQAEDEALLARGVDDAGAPLDWRVRRIIEFRVQRKRALR